MVRMRVRATAVAILAIVMLSILSMASAAEKKPARAKAKSSTKQTVRQPPDEKAAEPKQQAAPKQSTTKSATPKQATPKQASPKNTTPIEPETAVETFDEYPQDFTMDEWGGGYSLDTTCGVWTAIDYLLWHRQGRDVPPLVTTDPDGGVLPGATILFGSQEIGDDVRPGGRLRVGMFLDRCNCWSVEGSLLMLADGDVRFDVNSDTNATIARPFFNLTPDLAGDPVGEDALQVAAAGFASGSLLVQSNSDVLTADVTFRRPMCQSGSLLLDGLIGYEMARIDEDIIISSSSQLTGSTTSIDVVDSFATENEFHGGHIGLELARVCGRWDFGLLGKVGMGSMRQTVEIDGLQTATVGGITSSTTGGLLAQPTNIGINTRHIFAIAPELDFNVRCYLTCHLQLSAGYSILYWNRVAQPGDQIDLSVNPDQPPAANQAQRPAFTFRDSDYFLHGAHLGAQWSF